MMTNEELTLLRTGLLDLVKLIEGILHSHGTIFPVVSLPTTIMRNLDNGVANYDLSSTFSSLNPKPGSSIQTATITIPSNPSAPAIPASSYVIYDATKFLLSFTVGGYLTPGTNYQLTVTFSPVNGTTYVQVIPFSYMND
jgi:hypothetical protein